MKKRKIASKYFEKSQFESKNATTATPSHFQKWWGKDLTYSFTCLHLPLIEISRPAKLRMIDHTPGPSQGETLHSSRSWKALLYRPLMVRSTLPTRGPWFSSRGKASITNLKESLSTQRQWEYPYKMKSVSKIPSTSKNTVFTRIHQPTQSISLISTNSETKNRPRKNSGSWNHRDLV